MSLASVRLLAQGRHVLVGDSAGTWDEATKQLEFAFDGVAPEGPASVEADVCPRAEAASAESSAPDADWWFERGLSMEDGDSPEARAAYREAIALDPGHASAQANLGRLLHEEGSLEAAESHYRQALLADPQSPTAAFNLGVVLEDLGSVDEALSSYLKALEGDPDLAEAHFNAGRLLEARGKKAEALGHFAAYRKTGRLALTAAGPPTPPARHRARAQPTRAVYSQRFLVWLNIQTRTSTTPQMHPTSPHTSLACVSSSSSPARIIRPPPAVSRSTPMKNAVSSQGGPVSVGHETPGQRM